MTRSKIVLLTFLIGIFSLKSYASERIITAGGSITEIIYQLGAEELLVGVDMTSTYPEQVKALAQIGYWKQLSIEGILSLKPTLFIAWSDAEPQSIFAQLQATKIAVLSLQRVPNNLELLYENIQLIANAIDRTQQGEQLIAHITSQVTTIEEQIKQHRQKPTVLFLLSMSGVTQVAGKNTVADSVITLAGGENIAAHDYYKNYSAEAFITANPDVIIMTTQSLSALGGMSELALVAGVAYTDAWKNRRVMAIDQALILGMGPRVGEAAAILYNGFYPQ